MFKLKESGALIGQSPKIGIIQRSGFANGLYGAGARVFLDRCLEHHGFKISRVVGVSAQSFSVTLQSIGLLEEIAQAWLDLAKEDIYSFDKWGLLLNPIKFLRKWPAILDNTPLRNYVENQIKGHEDEIFSDKAIPFDIIATDISADKNYCHFFSNTPENKNIILDICMASATLVPWFKPVMLNIGGKRLLLADGAFSNDMPISRLIEYDCNVIFVVDYYGGVPGFNHEGEPPWHESTSRSLQVVVDDNSRLRMEATERMNREVEEFNKTEARLGSYNFPTKVLREMRQNLNIANEKVEIVHIQNPTKPNHIGFTEFNNKTKVSLVARGYYHAAQKMQELGFDIEPVLNMPFRKKLEFPI
ncbi:MAG: hypothetical protein Q8Q06_03365 [bacterium]|nr:hypothetical protein [bacterium]